MDKKYNGTTYGRINLEGELVYDIKNFIDEGIIQLDKHSIY